VFIGGDGGVFGNAKALRPTLSKSNRRDVSGENTLIVEYLAIQF
jgi:hypothetical protein